MAFFTTEGLDYLRIILVRGFPYCKRVRLSKKLRTCLSLAQKGSIWGEICELLSGRQTLLLPFSGANMDLKEGCHRIPNCS